MIKTVISLAITLFAFTSVTSQSQTKKITLKDVDELLVKNNLSLLAAKYDVDVAEAQKIQAKLFDNPDIGITTPAYSKEHGWFDFKGNLGLSLQQAIQVAGKRKAGIKLAESQKQLALWQYELLSKQLKYAAHTSYFTIYYLQLSINKTSAEITKIKNVIDAIQIQYDKGNITLNELIRLKASYNSLSSDVLELQNSIYEEENNLKTLLLLPIDSDLIPTPATNELNKYSLSLVNLDDIVKKAQEQHPEIKLADAAIYNSEMQLKYEKKQVIPDLQLGVSYNKAGDYVPYSTSATLGFSIPLFNRNQANIKIAKDKIKQSQISKDNQQNIISNEIKASYDKLTAIETRILNVGDDFEGQFDLLMNNVSVNYMKRNISILEFTDLIESYHEQIVQINNLRLQRVLAYEDLNYNTGYALFK